MIFKYLLLSMFFYLSSTLGVGDDIIKIATQQVKELDEMLILIDPNAALSTEQKELIVQLFVEKIEKTRSIHNTNESNKSQLVNQLMQDISSRLHNDILTKNQRVAKFEYQKNYQTK